MATSSVVESNAAHRSIILALAGVRQRRAYTPDGRVFKKLAQSRRMVGPGPDGRGEVLSYEETFLILFMRWLTPDMRADLGVILQSWRLTEDWKTLVLSFMAKARARETSNPPAWMPELSRLRAQGRQATAICAEARA